MKTDLAPATAPSPPADRLGPGLGQAVVILLGLQIVGMVLEILARLHQLDVWLIYRAGGFISQPQADQAARWISKVSWFGGLAFIVTGVVWLVWQHRAQTNAIAITGARLQFTPGWAVGWWFIPFANLGKPFQAVRELWKGSHGPGWQHLRTWRLIGWWWATWLASVITIGYWNSGDQYVIGSSSSSAGSVSSIITTDRFAVVRLAVRVIAAVLAISIVRSVTRLQTRAFADGTASPSRPDDVVMPMPVAPASATVEDQLAAGERAWVLGMIVAMAVLAIAGIAWTERAHAPTGAVPGDVPIALPPDGDLAHFEGNGVHYSYPSTWLGTSTSNDTQAAWPDPMWTDSYMPMSEPRRIGVTTSAYRLQHDTSEMSEEQRRAFVLRYAQHVADELPGTADTTIDAVPFGRLQGYRVGVVGDAAKPPVTAQIDVMLKGPFAYVVRCESTPSTAVEVAAGCAAVLSTYDVVHVPRTQAP